MFTFNPLNNLTALKRVLLRLLCKRKPCLWLNHQKIKANFHQTSQEGRRVSSASGEVMLLTGQFYITCFKRKTYTGLFRRDNEYSKPL